MNKQYAWKCGTQSLHNGDWSYVIRYTSSPDIEPKKESYYGWDEVIRFPEKDL